jgi:hypothetical protein
MIEIKKLSGIMNLDDKEENVAPSQHIDSLNLRFYGGANGLSAENIVGNTLITNSYIPAGTNECIGGFYDGIKQRLIWLNWNSNSRHGIYQYSVSTGVITPLIICFTNSQTDILGFDRNYPVSGIDIVYTTDIDGDILTWTTRNKRPKALNLLQAVNNTYGSSWLEEYLDVAKEPPRIPIKCAYENDSTVTVNNLRKKLFRFKYRYWYRDNQKSTWSSISEIPIPFGYTDPQVDTDQTKNCRIGCVIQTGDESVVKVEVAAQESLGNIFSNFFSTIILDKSDLSIGSNEVYIWRFYNSEAYAFVDLDESILDFDRVPDIANTQALLNGNVIVYGGITEGLDPVIPDVTVTDIDEFEYPLAIDCNNILSVTQYGVEGFKVGENIKFIVLGTIRRGQTFSVTVLVGATTYNIRYTAIVGDTPALVLAGLSASATGQGFTEVSISANDLVISRANQELLWTNITTTNQAISATFVITLATNVVRINGGASYLSLFSKGVIFDIYGNTLNLSPFVTVSSAVVGADLDITVEKTLANETITTDLYFISPINSSIPAYNSSSKENLGLVYFDAKGKTNGVTTSPDFNVNTPYLGMNKSLGSLLFYAPHLDIAISHRPPLWAKSFQWVRTANLTKQSSLFWMSDRTFKDNKYAYISIESINTYRAINKNSVISYDYLPGDRIKFYVLFDVDSSPDVVYTSAYPHDYEIFDVVVNPDLNGAVNSGRFIKIQLPELNGAGGTFDFGVTYPYYYIELYTPAKSSGAELDVYYEFSEEYAIGNAGTANAFHQGQLQNQTTDLVTPATFRFNKGDAWYRTREIETGNVIQYNIIPNRITQFPTILGQVQTLNTYNTLDFIVAQNIAQQPYIQYSPGWTLSVINNTQKFNVRGTLSLDVTSASIGNTLRIYFQVVTLTGVITQNELAISNNPVTGQQLVFNINKDIEMPAGSAGYLISFHSGVFSADITFGSIGFYRQNSLFKVGVIDNNFSDFYDSKINSDGRAFKINPDEKTNFFGTEIRHGKEYIQNTNINQINRFYPLDFDEFDRSKGDIQRLKSRDRALRIFQNRACGQLGVYSKFIQNNEGESQLVTTNDILTKNNINYYAGEYGMGNQYTSLVSGKNQDYFADPVRGYQMRLSNDGLTPISLLYKGQFYIRNLLTPYNKTYTRSNGTNAKILGCYDYVDEQYITLLQGGTNGSSTIDSHVFSFNEGRNGYCSKYSYTDAEWLLSAEDVIYSWKDGNLYSHDNTTDYCNFFGTQYDAYITLVFNINLFEKKTWQSVAELASAIWACPLVYTNVKSYGTQRQETALLESDFANLEGMFHTAFLRDIHSIGGINNGSQIKGNYLVCTFKKTNASGLISLSEVQVMWRDSPLTNK